MAEFKDVMAAYKQFEGATLKDRDALLTMGEIAAISLEVLKQNCRTAHQGKRPNGASEKSYDVYVFSGGRSTGISRPLRQGLFVSSAASFRKLWREVVDAAKPSESRLAHPRSDEAFYTCTQAFSCVIDIFQNASRKTPGTFFETLVSIALGYVSGLPRGKQISVPGEKAKVTTDLVLKAKPPLRSLVVPNKITTRERIVQAFVHQRILDAVAAGRYRSVLVAVSELKRTKQAGDGVEEICVTHQVALFQKYVAQLSGLYYLDPPYEYATAPFRDSLPVRQFSNLLATDLRTLISK